MNYETQRLLMCELGRRMWQKGWLASNDGNLSRRLGEGLFLITPAGASMGFLAPEMLVVVNDRGEGVEPSAYRPSSETPLHLACYLRRADVSGICHAHPPAATAFACARMALDAPILCEAILSLGRVPCAPYGRPGTEDLSVLTATLADEHNALLLSNHGALTLGRDLEQAYFRMETLEHTAQIHLNARMLGGGVPLPPEEEAALSALGGN